MNDIEDFCGYVPGREAGTLCRCMFCAASCLQTPGAYNPGDMTAHQVADVFTDVTLDYLVSGGVALPFLRPRVDHERCGNATYHVSQGPCVNLTLSGCRLDGLTTKPRACILSTSCRPHNAFSEFPLPIIALLHAKQWDCDHGRMLLAVYRACVLKQNPDAKTTAEEFMSESEYTHRIIPFRMHMAKRALAVTMKIRDQNGRIDVEDEKECEKLRMAERHKTTMLLLKK